MTINAYSNADSIPLSVLMCKPEWFQVAYSINTFMVGNQGKVDADLAQRQWESLYEAIAATGTTIELIPPVPQPDFVFTANAGLVWGREVIPARFYHRERAGEEVHSTEWFRSYGYEVVTLPLGVHFEGEGDVVLRKDHLFLGHGSRSSQSAGTILTQVTGLEVVALQLDPQSFYHLDTCMVSVGRSGYLFYYPGAFTEEGRLAISDRTPSSSRIEINQLEAQCFACNMVVLGETAIFPSAPPSFVEKVIAAGLKPVSVDLSEFMKAGGAAKCLTLHLRSLP